MFELIGGMGVLAGLIVLSGIKFVNEYDRLVIFRLGRVVGERGPGLAVVFPLIERAQKVDLRVVTLPIPQQDTITRDNISVKVADVCFFQVVDARKTVTQIEDAVSATSQDAQTTLRSVIGQHELDQILTQRDQVNAKLQAIVDRQTETWGIKVNAVEIKDVELPKSMQRAMAKQAEAERERRAKVVAAEGEFQAAERLVDAARVMANTPGTMQLRQLQTMREIAAEKESTLIFPLALDMTSGFTSPDDET